MIDLELFKDPENQLRIAIDRIKPSLLGMECPIHKRKLRLRSVRFYYDEEYLYAEIWDYCCTEFAEQVANIILEGKMFDKVYIIEGDQKRLCR
ncbi:hypothetical protein SAMN05444001_108139 [Parabacteroides chinchillae]|uniref:Uncharacterized protein n=1 Tax=Parabacteroides chinchillae TaxID=871327 RepID=A0A8G2F4C5_9BACT|nr:hypothetical protein SAMN05444001_108139 [Parabacteroides chinchillae]